MGCGNCGVKSDGKPAGCGSSGGCSSGGCNKMNVYDWLAELPIADSLAPFNILEVSFNNGSRKEFYKNNGNLHLDRGELVTVEGIGGFDVGSVNLTGELVKLQLKKMGVKWERTEFKRVLRRASDEDMAKLEETKIREVTALVRSRAIARQLNLNMKLSEVEIQADGKKATFFYTADDRVDFRELIKIFASEFKVKVEMRQIGARQESAKVGGIGTCGRELCCSTWLTDFKSVNTSAARYQNLSINQTKLSGQCGRLKCCLNYELDTYLDALRVFPDNAETIDTASGPAYLLKKDIFKNLMWYTYSDSNKQYPLTISRVREIQEMNRRGQKPEELKAVELESKNPKQIADIGFVDVVGQISLKNLEKSSRKPQNKKRRSGGEQPQGGKEEQGQQPQQQQQPREQRSQQPRQGGQPRRDNRDNREPREPREPRQQQGNRPQAGNAPKAEPQPGQQPQQGQQPREQRPQQQRQGGPRRDNRENREPREPREPRQQQAPNPGGDAPQPGSRNHDRPRNPRSPRRPQQSGNKPDQNSNNEKKAE